MDARREYGRAGRARKSAGEVARQVAIERRRERAATEPFTIVPDRDGGARLLHRDRHERHPLYGGDPRPGSLPEPLRLPRLRGQQPRHLQAHRGGAALSAARHTQATEAARTTLVERRRLHVRIGLAYDGGWKLAPEYDEFARPGAAAPGQLLPGPTWTR